MQFVGWEDGDLRYCHAYTTNSLSPGVACCLFPCTDNVNARCTWDISIKCNKTVGDAFSDKPPQTMSNGTNGFSNGADGHRSLSQPMDRLNNFRAEDKALDLVVICTGEMTDEVSAIQRYLDCLTFTDH